MAIKKYNIVSGNNEWPASDYQNAIFDEIENGSHSIVVNACAGSAKTTTIINACRYIDNRERIAFIAFNKEIVNEISRKISGDNVLVTTYHSLGYKILKENDYDFELRDEKYIIYANRYISENSSVYASLSKKKDRSLYLKNVHDLINRSRYYLLSAKKAVRALAEQFEMEIVADEVDIVMDVLRWGRSETSVLDYMDLIWFPNIHNLVTTRYMFDWIFIDEAQDTSVAQQKLIEKCFRKNTRFVAVGDDCQQINVWCGASKDAISNLSKLRDTVTLDLPISYRCPVKVVELASEYSKNIIAREGAETGVIRDSVSINSPKDGDIVLCRMTAPLVELHVGYHMKNKRSRIRGAGDVKSRYLSYLEGFSRDDVIDRTLSTEHGLMPSLYRRIFNEIERIMAEYSVDEKDAVIHNSVINMYDDICGIEALSFGLSNVGSLYDKIESVFFSCEDDTGCIDLMTIHKSKGLEADNVYILCPSLLPSPMAKTKDEVQAEKNLCYVAYTRARKTLNFMEESPYSKIDGSRFKPENIFADLSRKRIYVRGTGQKNTKKPSPMARLTKLNSIGSEKVAEKPDERRKTHKAGMKFRKFLE